ncbi:MAG TPA: alpha/beta hydrolase-fold protein [Ramlibacter sp.]
MKAIARAFATALVAVLCACGGGGGAGGSAGGPGVTPQVGRVESISLLSTNTGYNYPINVYLPPQYDANAQAHLPVIFAVDGDAQFGYDGNATRFDALKQALQQRGTGAILVGVGGTVRRNTDFLPFGSIAYHAFLTQELVPAIDARYRTDTAQRILSGLSYGGTITFLAFTYEGATTPTFRYFWSTETAAPNGMPQQLFDAEAAMQAAVQGRAVPVTLFFAGANNFNGPLVNQLYTQVLSRNYAGLDVEQVTYATTHVGADLPAFNEALTRFVH